MNTQDDHGREQAAAQARSIAAMVAALDLDWDRLEELRDTEPADLSDDDREELAEMETIVADSECENREQAEERIQGDPLSVEVRSGWATVSDNLQPEEFRILLCTGGPAVQIRGELDEYRQPCCAWMEYQDWGTPWTRYFDVEQETLLRYCSCFYFGE